VRQPGSGCRETSSSGAGLFLGLQRKLTLSHVREQVAAFQNKTVSLTFALLLASFPCGAAPRRCVGHRVGIICQHLTGVCVRIAEKTVHTAGSDICSGREVPDSMEQSP
jgi:hypothetical protein